jgi:hypothetical protein
VYKNRNLVPRVIQIDIRERDRVMIFCYVPGVSSKHLEWTKNGDKIRSKKESRIAQHRVERPLDSKRLKIYPFHIEDQGMYMCKRYDEKGRHVVEAKHVQIKAGM